MILVIIHCALSKLALCFVFLHFNINKIKILNICILNLYSQFYSLIGPTEFPSIA